MATTNEGNKQRGRPAKGSLYWCKSGWRARLRVDVDGERVQKSFDLGTHDKAAARIKMRRLLASKNERPAEELQSEAQRGETFEEAARRIVGASIIKTRQTRLERMQLHIFPAIGSLPVGEVRARHVRDILQALVDEGMSKQQCIHVRNDISAVLGELWREEILPENVTKKVRIPAGAVVDTRERAVLTDDELLTYLAWEHPEKGRRGAVLQRKTMALVARIFGGLRMNDLRHLKWESFDIDDGAFPSGWVPRVKTKRAQLLEVPGVLRPHLRKWWEAQGRPVEGFVFPVRLGDRAGEQRAIHSIVKPFQRDLRRALGVDTFEVQTIIRANGRTLQKVVWTEGTPRTRREVELFEDTDFTRKVDFHSFRRGFKQGLADAGVDLQTAMTLSGATDAKTHQRYLKRTGRMATIPSAALPSLSIDRAQSQKGDSVEAGVSSCQRADLNCRPHAYESVPGETIEPKTAPREKAGAPVTPPEPLTTESHAQLPCTNSDMAKQAILDALTAAMAARQWDVVRELAGVLKGRHE